MPYLWSWYWLLPKAFSLNHRNTPVAPYGVCVHALPGAWTRADCNASRADRTPPAPAGPALRRRHGHAPLLDCCLAALLALATAAEKSGTVEPKAAIARLQRARSIAQAASLGSEPRDVVHRAEVLLPVRRELRDEQLVLSTQLIVLDRGVPVDVVRGGGGRRHIVDIHPARAARAARAAPVRSQVPLIGALPRFRLNNARFNNDEFSFNSEDSN